MRDRNLQKDFKSTRPVGDRRRRMIDELRKKESRLQRVFREGERMIEDKTIRKSII